MPGSQRQKVMSKRLRNEDTKDLQSTLDPAKGSNCCVLYQGQRYFYLELIFGSSIIIQSQGRGISYLGIGSGDVHEQFIETEY